jgi:hypothetical protein
MAQRPLDSFGFGASLSVGTPPPTSQRSTPAPGPSGSHTPANQTSRKHPSVPPADTAAQNPSFGVALADPDRQLILQLSLQVERMEKALLSSQATSTNRIHELEKQVASITAELHRMRQQHSATPAPNKPTGNNPDRGRSSARTPTQRVSTPATPCPHKPTTDDLTWAARITAAADTNEKQFTTVSRKKKKSAPPPLIPKSLPRIEREIIITCNLDIIPVAERKAFSDMALMRFNSIIVWSAEIDLPPFIFARTNSNNKMVLTTNHTTPAAAYKPYLQLFTNQITRFTPTAAEINTRWSKFLVHNIPTDAYPSAIQEHIELTYPTLRLAQTPRWLVPTDRRTNKQASTLVISLLGTIDLKHLGTTTLTLCNRKCRITPYFSWTPDSHCHNCQGYGHHTKLCKAEKPTCTICAQQHNTKDHLCTIPTCRAGNSYTHPPVKCAACSAPHKATDPLCPERIRHLSSSRHKAPTPEEDESMETTL